MSNCIPLDVPLFPVPSTDLLFDKMFSLSWWLEKLPTNFYLARLSNVLPSVVPNLLQSLKDVRNWLVFCRAGGNDRTHLALCLTFVQGKLNFCVVCSNCKRGLGPPLSSWFYRQARKLSSLLKAWWWKTNCWFSCFVTIVKPKTF